MFKQQKGMTLYALVFTIIAMLALAAVAVAMVLDEFTYDPAPKQVYGQHQEVNNNNVEETKAPETPTIIDELVNEMIKETPSNSGENQMPTVQSTDNGIPSIETVKPT